MLAITQATRATDIALVKIAKAFLQQTFPLTEEGRSLKQDISRVLELNDFPWLRSNVWQLPTFEHPHLKLFSDLNFGSLTEREVIGHKLVTVQCHRGCSHDCEGFCDSDAPRRIVQRMPTLGLYRIAQAKARYDRHYGRIMWNWHGLIRKMGIIKDEQEFDQKIEDDDMTIKEFLRILIEVDQLCDLHPIAQHLRR